MPTLVWIRRRRSGTSGAGAGGGVSAAAAAAAAPDPAVSASSAALQVALPVVSSKQKATCSGKKTNRKRNRANAATTAKKKSKTASGRDLPTRGVRKTQSGKFKSEIRWGGKTRCIGTFQTPEHASAAYISVKKDLNDAIVSSRGAHEMDDVFDKAKQKAVDSLAEKRDLPRGVRKLLSDKFQSTIWWDGKKRTIGTFDAPEQASAAYMSVRKDLDGANVSSCGANDVEGTFDEAKKKGLELFGGFVPEKRDLPPGVYKTSSGKFRSEISWRGKMRHIFMFDTSEQASAAYVSVRKDLDDAKQSAFGAAEVDALFDEAKKKAVEAVGGSVPKKDLPRGVTKLPSTRKFQSRIYWDDKNRYIGTFDSPEQASAAYMSVRKDLDDANISTFSADEVEGIFDEAKKKALEAVGGFVTRDLPRGVKKKPSGKFQSQFWWGGKTRNIGTFDTPEQASAAYNYVKRDLGNAKVRQSGPDTVKSALFDAAKKKALKAIAER